MRGEKGFTLIELSIVLVIIGLIVGGVLAGKDLITAAAIRADIMDMAEYNAATNAFKNKYNGLPGDMPNASRFFATMFNGAAGTYLNGDGNFQINVRLTNTNNWYFFAFPESAKYFSTLYTAKLITLDYRPGEGAAIPGNCGDVTMPVSHVRGRIGVFTNSDAYTSLFDSAFHNNPDNYSYYMLGLGIHYSDCTTVTSQPTADVPGAWKPVEAYQLDSKLDDGKPMTGNTRTITDDGVSENAAYDTVPGRGDVYNRPPCVTAASEYNIATPALTCALRVRAAW